VGIDESKKPGNIVMIPYIGCFASDFTAGFCRHFGDGLVNGGLLASTDGDLRSFFQEHFGDGAPDSAGGAGDETDFVSHMFLRIRGGSIGNGTPTVMEGIQLGRGVSDLVA
jgi:hypothetical protein